MDQLACVRERRRQADLAPAGWRELAQADSGPRADSGAPGRQRALVIDIGPVTRLASAPLRGPRELSDPLSVDTSQMNGSDRRGDGASALSE